MSDWKKIHALHDLREEFIFLKILLESYTDSSNRCINPINVLNKRFVPSDYLSKKLINIFIDKGYIIPLGDDILRCYFRIAVDLEQINAELTKIDNEMSSLSCYHINGDPVSYGVISTVFDNECLGFMEHYCAENGINLDSSDTELIEEKVLPMLSHFIHEYRLGKVCSIIYSAISRYLREMNEKNLDIASNFQYFICIVESYLERVESEGWDMKCYGRIFNLKISCATEYCHVVLPSLPDLYEINGISLEEAHVEYTWRQK